jgi:type IV secretory pathway TrbD component
MEKRMTQARRINTVYRTLHRPLTVLGVERKLFFFAMCMGAATFNMLSSLLGGILMFFLLYLAARWATKTDPQILRFLFSAAKFKTQYDPSKLSPITIRRTSNA